jgi:hypothetical protein
MVSNKSSVSIKVDIGNSQDESENTICCKVDNNLYLSSIVEFSIIEFRTFIIPSGLLNLDYISPSGSLYIKL